MGVGLPRWAILLFGGALVLFGIAASQGWIRDPSLARSDYAGTIDVSADEVVGAWQDELAAFDRRRQQYLIYRGPAA